MSIENIKNIVLVSSAKGGVGKSTVTANLAAALHLKGHKVGIVDCDIYGPSQNKMFSISGLQEHIHEPVESHGIKLNSIANRIGDGKTIAWRGPMLKVAVMDLILETNWGELDYLLIDMPPGTGDIQLSICEKINQAVAVIVTTPQEVATIDTERGIDLYVNTEINVIGIIENMCGYVCGGCGKVEYIFGQGGGRILADKYCIELLGEIPIETNIRVNGDNGKPITFDKKTKTSKLYSSIAGKILNNEKGIC
jgi:ATP-binding protein involved in chromosome partitioning